MEVGRFLELAFDRGPAFLHLQRHTDEVIAEHQARQKREAEEAAARRRRQEADASNASRPHPPPPPPPQLESSDGSPHPSSALASPAADASAALPQFPLVFAATAAPVAATAATADRVSASPLVSAASVLPPPLQPPSSTLEVAEAELLAKLQRFSAMGPRWANWHHESPTHLHAHGSHLPGRPRVVRPTSARALSLWAPLDADGVPQRFYAQTEDAAADSGLWDETREWILARRATHERTRQATEADRRAMQHAARVHDFREKRARAAEQSAATATPIDPLSADDRASSDASAPGTPAGESAESLFDVRTLFGAAHALLPFERSLLRDRYTAYRDAQTAALNAIHAKRESDALAAWQRMHEEECARRTRDGEPRPSEREIEAARELVVDGLVPLEQTLIPWPIPNVTFAAAAAASESAAPLAAPAAAAEPPAYLAQGDPNMYTDASLDVRASLRSHPLIVRLLDLFWRTFAEKDSQRGLVRREYVEVHMRMQRAVLRDLANGVAFKQREQADIADKEKKLGGAKNMASAASAAAKAAQARGRAKGKEVAQDAANDANVALVSLSGSTAPVPVSTAPVSAVPPPLKSLAPLPRSTFDPVEAEKLAQRDWTRDTRRTAGNSSGLKQQAFQDALFELVDVWTETTDPDEYVDFLSVLYARITKTAPNSGATSGTANTTTTSPEGKSRKLSLIAPAAVPVAALPSGVPVPVVSGKWRPLKEVPFDGLGVEDLWSRFIEREKQREAARLKRLLLAEQQRVRDADVTRNSTPEPSEEETSSGAGDSPADPRRAEKRRMRRAGKVARVKRKERRRSRTAATPSSTAASVKPPAKAAPARDWRTIAVLASDGTKQWVRVAPHERVIDLPSGVDGGVGAHLTDALLEEWREGAVGLAPAALTAGGAIDEGDEQFEWETVYLAQRVDEQGDTIHVRKMRRVAVEAEQTPTRRANEVHERASPVHESPTLTATAGTAPRQSTPATPTPPVIGGPDADMSHARRRSSVMVPSSRRPSIAIPVGSAGDAVVGLGRGVTGTKQPKRLQRPKHNQAPSVVAIAMHPSEPEVEEVVDPESLARTALLASPPPIPPPACTLAPEDHAFRRGVHESHTEWLRRLERDHGYDRRTGTIESIAADGTFVLREFDPRDAMWTRDRDRKRWQEAHGLSDEGAREADQLAARYVRALRHSQGLPEEGDASHGLALAAGGIASQASLLSQTSLSSMASLSSGESPAWDPDHRASATALPTVNPASSASPRSTPLRATMDPRVQEQLARLGLAPIDSTRVDEGAEDEESSFDEDADGANAPPPPVETDEERRARRRAARKAKKDRRRAREQAKSSSVSSPLAPPIAPATADTLGDGAVWKHLAREVAIGSWQRGRVREARQAAGDANSVQAVFQVTPLAVRVTEADESAHEGEASDAHDTDHSPQPDIDPEQLKASTAEYHHVAGVYQFATPAAPFRQYSTLIHTRSPRHRRTGTESEAAAHIRDTAEEQDTVKAPVTEVPNETSVAPSEVDIVPVEPEAPEPVVPLPDSTSTTTSSPALAAAATDSSPMSHLENHPLHWSQPAEVHEAHRAAEAAAAAAVARARRHAQQEVARATQHLREGQQTRTIRRNSVSPAKSHRTLLAQSQSPVVEPPLAIHTAPPSPDRSAESSLTSSPAKRARGLVLSASTLGSLVSARVIDLSSLDSRLARLAARPPPIALVVDPVQVQRIVEEDVASEAREKAAADDDSDSSFDSGAPSNDDTSDSERDESPRSPVKRAPVAPKSISDSLRVGAVGRPRGVRFPPLHAVPSRWATTGDDEKEDALLLAVAGGGPPRLAGPPHSRPPYNIHGGLVRGREHRASADARPSSREFEVLRASADVLDAEAVERAKLSSRGEYARTDDDRKEATIARLHTATAESAIDAPHSRAFNNSWDISGRSATRDWLGRYYDDMRTERDEATVDGPSHTAREAAREQTSSRAPASGSATARTFTFPPLVPADHATLLRLRRVARISAVKQSRLMSTAYITPPQHQTARRARDLSPSRIVSPRAAMHTRRVSSDPPPLSMPSGPPLPTVPIPATADPVMSSPRVGRYLAGISRLAEQQAALRQQQRALDQMYKKAGLPVGGGAAAAPAGAATSANANSYADRSLAEILAQAAAKSTPRTRGRRAHA